MPIRDKNWDKLAVFTTDADLQKKLFDWLKDQAPVEPNSTLIVVCYNDYWHAITQLASTLTVTDDPEKPFVDSELQELIEKIKQEALDQSKESQSEAGPN